MKYVKMNESSILVILEILVIWMLVTMGKFALFSVFPASPGPIELYSSSTGYQQDIKYFKWHQYFPYRPTGHGYTTYAHKSFMPFGYGYRPYYGYNVYQNSHKTVYPGYERPMTLKSEYQNKDVLYGDY